MVEKLKAIEKTLESLEIKTTYDNMNKLLGCLQLLKIMIEESIADEKKGGISNVGLSDSQHDS